MAVKKNKTKAELEQEIKELQKQVKDMEKYKGYKDTADEIAAMRNAFVEAGFSEEESFTLVGSMVDKVIGAAIRRFL